MLMFDEEKATETITIGDMLYRTGGNILFEGQYFLAESPILEKMDKTIQAGILENGMQALLKKIKG